MLAENFKPINHEELKRILGSIEVKSLELSERSIFLFGYGSQPKSLYDGIAGHVPNPLYTPGHSWGHTRGCAVTP